MVVEIESNSVIAGLSVDEWDIGQEEVVEVSFLSSVELVMTYSRRKEHIWSVTRSLSK